MLVRIARCSKEMENGKHVSGSMEGISSHYRQCSEVVCKSVTKEPSIKVQSKFWLLEKHLGLRDWTIWTNHQGQGSSTPGKIYFKTRERSVGDFVYVTQTNTSFVPYFKGVYLTLNSWHLGRDKEG